VINISRIARPIALAGAIAFSGLWMALGADAQGLTIGAVQNAEPTSFCGVYLPGGQQPMVIQLLAGDPTSKNALVNVDGQDVPIKLTSFRWIKNKKRSVAVYKGKNLTVTIDAQILRTIQGGLETTESIDRVTFKRGKLTKTIVSKGSCSI
jgi:flagellin-like hook-associated protein FlgL